MGRYFANLGTRRHYRSPSVSRTTLGNVALRSGSHSQFPITTVSELGDLPTSVSRLDLAKKSTETFFSTIRSSPGIFTEIATLTPTLKN